MAKGEVIYDHTIGDYDRDDLPIPEALQQAIVDSLYSQSNELSNANGMESLRNSVSKYLSNHLDLDNAPNEILISGGARPSIQAIYQTILNIDDTVLYPVPSWNNDAYTYFARNKAVVLETKPENKFMPTVEGLRPHIKNINLIAL